MKTVTRQQEWFKAIIFAQADQVCVGLDVRENSMSVAVWRPFSHNSNRLSWRRVVTPDGVCQRAPSLWPYPKLTAITTSTSSGTFTRP